MKEPKHILQCATCGKGVQHSNLVSFSKNRVHHVRKPNLHTHHLVIEGERVKIRVCTSCKRELRLVDRVAQAKEANSKIQIPNSK